MCSGTQDFVGSVEASAQDYEPKKKKDKMYYKMHNCIAVFHDSFFFFSKTLFVGVFDTRLFSLTGVDPIMIWFDFFI